MTCAVPHCAAEALMQGLCSAHWLEADEAAHGHARIAEEVAQVRADEACAADRQRRMIEQQRALRDPIESGKRAEVILGKIITRFWDEATSGGRNNALAGAAWAAGRLVAGGELGAEETLERLTSEAVAAGLPRREALDVARGQIRRARSQPRVLGRPQVARRWARA